MIRSAIVTHDRFTDFAQKAKLDFVVFFILSHDA